MHVASKARELEIFFIMDSAICAILLVRIRALGNMRNMQTFAVSSSIAGDTMHFPERQCNAISRIWVVASRDGPWHILLAPALPCAA